MLEYFNNKLITVIDGKHTKEEILKIMVDLIGENSDAPVSYTHLTLPTT